MPTVEHTSDDITLSAHLSNLGFELEEIRAVNGSAFSVFVFKDSPELRVAVRAFYARKARVEPLGLLEMIRTLKAASRRPAMLRGDQVGGRR